MDLEKHNRSINLLCPTCGGSEFSYDDNPEEGQLTCVSCKREIYREELIRENSENINEHITEVKNGIKKEIADEFRKMFSGK